VDSGSTAPLRARVRSVGWERFYVATRRRVRVTYAEMLRGERGTTRSAFLRRAVAFDARLGVRIQRVVPDSGSGSRPSATPISVSGCESSTSAPVRIGRSSA
jgi:hypothetical protein